MMRGKVWRRWQGGIAFNNFSDFIFACYHTVTYRMKRFPDCERIVVEERERRGREAEEKQQLADRQVIYVNIKEIH